MNEDAVKGLSAVILFATAMLGGALPFWLKARQKKTNKKDKEEERKKKKEKAEQEALQHESHALEISPGGDGGALHSPASRRGSFSAIRSSSFRTRHPEAGGRRRKRRRDMREGEDAGVEEVRSGRCCNMDVDRFLSLGNMLGAGIFLGGGLMHLLPEAHEDLEHVQHDWPESLHEFPTAFLLCGLGFFMILIVEEITIMITSRKKKKKPSDKKKKKEEEVIQPLPVGHGHSLSQQPDSVRMLHGAAATTSDASSVPDSQIEVAAQPHVHKRTRNIPRTLMQGLTHRVALVRDFPPADESSCMGSDCDADEDEDEYEEAGPIQSFLDAAYNSPSPFPSLSDPRVRRARLQRLQAASGRSTWGVPDDDEDDTGSEFDVGTPIEPLSLGQPAVIASPSSSYRSSSRALAGSNAAVNRARSGSNGSLAGTPLPDAPLGELASPNSLPGSLKQPLLLDSSPNLSSSPSPLAPAPVKVVGFPLSGSPPPASPSHRGSPRSKAESKLARQVRAKVKSVPVLRTPQDDEDDDDAEAGTAKLNGHAKSKSRRKKHAHRYDEGHGHGSGHGHSHGGGDGHSHFNVSSDTSYIVAYLLVLALSFHSIFEGIALGTQDSMPAIISLSIAILAHTPLAGFALGVSLVKARAAPVMAWTCLFLFSVMTPLGTVLGILLSVFLEGHTLQLVSAVFQAFSAGTFLFVALEEIIPKEMAMKKDKKLKLTLAVLGFLAMAGVKLAEPGHSHGPHDHDDHDHDHDDHDHITQGWK